MKKCRTNVFQNKKNLVSLLCLTFVMSLAQNCSDFEVPENISSASNSPIPIDGENGSNGNSENQGSGGEGPTKPSTKVSSDLNDWDESATFRYFSSDLELVWQNKGGDWVDADDIEQGPKPFSTHFIKDNNQPEEHEIDVTQATLHRNKASYFLKSDSGGTASLHSRQADLPANRPKLLVNQTITLTPYSDVSMNNTTSRSLGESKTLATGQGFFIQFELPKNVKVTSAKLILQSTGAEYGNHNLQVFVPNSSIRLVPRPSWLKVNPQVVVEFDGNDVFRERYNMTVKNDIATSKLLGPSGLTWINANMPIPNLKEGCATVYQMLGSDFRPGDGGKHPGFGNTHDSTRGSDVIDGVTYPDTGWGGRRPDGIHWSARSGYGKWNDKFASSHTYFYAMEPHNKFGWGDPIGHPFEKGKWIAYIQCLKLNTVTGPIGNRDGKLYYEIVGVGPTYSREDIRWRDRDIPESEIREFWVNYYCGGVSCGTIANRGTISFHKAVITHGLPDLAAVQREVDRLNRDFPEKNL